MILTASQHTKLFSLKKFSGLLVLIISALISIGAMPASKSLPSEDLNLPLPAPTPNSVCQNGTATFTATGGATFLWEVSSNGGTSWTPLGVTTQTLTLSSVGMDKNNYWYHCLINSDPLLTEVWTLIVNPLPSTPAAISGTTTVCQGEVNKSFSISAVSNALSYVWTLPPGASIVSGDGTISIVVNFSPSASSGNLQVVGNNSCGDGAPSTVYLTVNPLPGAAGTISGTGIVCQGQSSVTYSVPTITNATGYAWTPPTGASITSGSNTANITVNYNAVSTSGNVTVKGTNTCGSGIISASFPVTVNPTPGAAGAVSGTASVCQGQSGVPYSVSAITNASSYTWNLPTGATIATGNGTNSITVNFTPSAVSGNISVYGSNACGNGTTSTNFAVTVGLLPSAAGTITGSSSVCQGHSGATYTVPAIPNATSYTWSLPSGGSITNGSGTNSITVSYTGSASSGLVTVYGTNSCGSGTISSGFPVTVSAIPAAAGAITGLSTVCQQQYGVGYTIGAIANATGYTWTTPSGSGISSGSNTNSIILDYWTAAASGSLTVAGTNGCGTGTQATLSITVNDLPGAAGTVSGLTTVCQGQPGVTYSVPAVSNASGYTWSLPVGASITNGSGTNSITVSYAASASSGNVSVYGTNTCGNGVASANLPVTVNVLPAAAGPVSGTSVVCQGQTGAIYSVSGISNATSYVWSLPSGASITSGSGTNSITVTYLSSAISGNVTVYGINGCGSGTASTAFPVTVTALPVSAGSISGTATVCQGQNGVVYTVGSIGNATGYTWAIPTGASIVSGSNTNSITVNYSSSATSGTVTVMGNNACGSGSLSTFAVTVNPLPAAAGTIVGPPTVCQGQTGVNYQVSDIANATGYSWSLPAGAIITVGNNTKKITVTFSGSATSGVVTVLGTNSCGSGTVSADFPVTVNPTVGVAGTITGTSVVCQGQNGITFQVPAITNATAYNWSLPTGANIVGGAGTNSITVNFTATAISGNINVTGTNSCGSGTVSPDYALTVNPLPIAAGVITGTGSVCQGSTGVTFSVAAITNATGYTWTLPNGASITAGANTRSITVTFSAIATSGNITVTGTNTCGNGTASNPFPVTVSPLPAAAGTIVGTQEVCQSTQGSYTIPAISNATGYTWSLPAGASISSGANTNSIIVNYSGIAVSGNVSVFGTNTCGSGAASAAFAVAVRPGVPAAAGPVVGSTIVCQGQTGLIYSVPALANATTYLWTLPVGANIVAGGTTNSITVNFSNVAVGGDISVHGVNACGDGLSSAALTITVNPLPIAAGSITGTATVCQSQTAVPYSVPVITNATGYTWTVPSGATVASGNNSNSITVDYGVNALSGNITVTGTNACGSGASATFPVTVNPLPSAAGIISGTPSVCIGTSYSYSVPAISNATVYHWAIPTGATFVGPSNGRTVTVNFDPGSISGNVTVFASNSCGNGVISNSYAVTVGTIPTAAGTIAGQTTICQGQLGVQYSIPTVPTATGYVWTVPSGASIVSSTNLSSITVDFSNLAVSGNITVYPTNNCGNGTISTLAVTVNNLPGAPAVIISGNSQVCQGQTGASYSIATIANASSYTWTLPSGATVTGGDNTRNITVAYSSSAQSGVYTVRGTNACGDGPVSIDYPVTVDHVPDAAGQITGTASVCQGQNGVIYTVPSITHATSYSWLLPTGATIVAGSNTNSITVNFSSSASSGNVSVSGVNACATGLASTNFAVTVQPKPAAAGTISGSFTVCQGQTVVSYSVASIANASSYVWSLPTGASITSGSATNSILVTYSSSSASGNISVYGTNSCADGTPSTQSVIVNPLPSPAGTITGNSNVCDNATGIMYSIPVIPNATGYLWTLPTGAVITSGNNTNIITVSFPAGTSSGNISVLGTNTCGNGLSSPVLAVTVSRLPSAAGSITGISPVCQGQTSVSYSVPAILNASSYIWTLPPNATITSGSNTNSIIVSFANNSTSGNVTVKGTNICGNGTVSGNFPVVVNQLPADAGTITGSSVVCQGQNNVSYTVPSILNANQYNWTVPAGVTIISGQGTNSILVNFSATATAGSISVYGHNSCGDGQSSSYSFAVNNLPSAAGAITGSGTVCSGQSGATYSVASIPNATGYSWTVPTGATVVSGGTTNSITVDFTALATSGNVTVHGTNACGSGTNSPNFAVSVQSVPAAAGSITGSGTVCQGQTGILYTVPSISNATGYVWTLPSGASIVAGANTNSITVNYSLTASSGTVTVYGTSACGPGSVSPALSVTVGLLPSAAGTISGPAIACQGSAGKIYSVSAIPNATIYSWSLPNGATITAGSNTSTITVSFGPTAVSGNISVSGVNSCGNGSTSVAFPVTVSPLPVAAAAITGQSNVCQGSSGISYTVPVISNATGYFWSVPSGASIASGNNTNTILVDFSGSASSGNITVYGINSCGNGAVSSNFPVILSTLPDVAGTITGPAVVCPGSSGNVYAVPSIANATSYTWTLPSGASIISGAGTNSIMVSYSLSAVSGNFAVAGTNVCGSGTASANYPVVVSPLPGAAGTITGASTVCQGNTGISYTVPTISNATGYTWNLPVGASISSGANTNSITVTYSSSAVSGNVSVYGTNICGNGTPSSNLAVTVNLLPLTALNITGPSTACQNDAGVSYSIPAIQNATSYQWTIPTGTTIASGSGTNNITLNFSGTAVSGTLSVHGVNACGNGADATLPITIYSTPILTSTQSPPAICSNSIFSYTPAGTPTGVSFSWTRAAISGISNLASTGTGNPNETLVNTTTSPITVTYVYTASVNGCTNPSTYNVRIVVNPVPRLSSITDTINHCNNSVLTYIPTCATTGTTFNWTRAAVSGITNAVGSGSGTINETLVNNTNSPVFVTYAYTLSANGCDNIQNLVVKVNPTFVLTSSLSALSVCSSTPLSYIPTASAQGTVFNWSRLTVLGISNAPATGTGDPAETLINTTILPVSVNYTYTLSLNSCNSPVTYTLPVTVKPSAILTSSLTPAAICSGTSFTYAPSTSVSGAVVSWSRALTAGITNAASSGTGSINELLTNNTTSPVAVTYVLSISSGGCTTSQNVVVTVNPSPTLTSALNPSVVCNNSPFSYTPASATVGTTYAWSRATVVGISNSANSGTGSINETLVNTGSSAIAVTYAYVLTANGCSNSQNVVVTINPSPTLTSLLTAPAICSGSIFSYTPTSSTTGTVFNWTRVAVSGISNPAAGGIGNPNETLVNSGALPLTVTYVYSLAVNGCTNPSTYSVSVVVNPAPVLSSSLTPSAICSNTPFSYTPTSSTAGSTFNWSRSTVPGISNPAAVGSGNPGEVLINTSSSAVTVNYNYTLSANGCSASQNVAVVVNPYPTLTSTPTPQGICSNTLFSYTPTSGTAGTTFSWSRSSILGISNPATSGIGNPNEVLVNTTTSPINVTYAYTLSANGCTNPSTYNVIVTVSPIPSLSSSLTPPAICSNTTFAYTPASSSGTIAGWTRDVVAGINNPASGGTGNPNEILVNTTASPVNVTYVYTLSSGGCTNTQNVVVTVNPSPVLSGTLAPSGICSNSIFSYSPASYTTGATFNWSRMSVAGISNLPSSGVGNPNETLINTSTATVAVSYNYQVTANGCNSSQNVVVNVSPIPILTSSLTPSPICSNSQFTYTPQSSTVGTIFSWSRAAVGGVANPTSSGFGNPNETLINTTNSPVNVTYVYSLSANGCANPTSYNVTVAVNPAPTLSSSLSPGSVCSGTLLNYSATSSTSGAVMTWTRPMVTGISQPASNGSGNISEFLSNSTSLPVNVTYQYTLFANGCTSNQNVVFTVNPAPILTSSLTPSPICSGNSFVYNATCPTPSTTFHWSRLADPNIVEPATSGSSSAINETLTNSTLAPVNVTYTYTLTANLCPNPSSYNVIVTVNPKPAVPVISPASPVTFCAGGSVVLTSTSSNGYQWSTGELTQSINASNSGSYFVIVRDANGCQSAQSAAVTVTALPLPTVFAGSDGTVCAGSNFTVSGATVMNHSSFAWSSSGTGTFLNQGTLSPTYVASVLDQSNGSVVLTLTGFSNSPCTASVSDVMNLTIQPKPTANAGPDQSLCYPSSLVISGATATNYQSLVWSHNGTGVLSSLNSITPTYIPGAGDAGRTVTVTLTAHSINPCNITAVDAMNIVVGSMPGDPGVITGSITVCKPSSSSLVYSIAQIAGVTTYNWNLPPGATLASSGNSNIIRVSFPSGASSGDLSVYGTNSCGNGPVSTLSIQVNDIPANPGSINGTSTVCQGKTGVAYSVAAVTGATSYTWTVPTGATINGSSTGSSITVDYGSTAISGNVVVYATNACGVGTSSTKAITVNVKPTAFVISPASGQLTTFCEGGNAWLNGPNLGTGYNYLWSPYGATSQNNLVTAGGTYHLTVTNSITGCSTDASNSIPVTVNPAPTPPVSIGYITYCWDGTGAPPVLNANDVTTVPPTSSLKWYDAPMGGNVVVVPPTNNLVGTINAVIYYAESTDIISGCKSLTRTPVRLTIVQNPSTPVNGLNQIACEQSPIQTLTATTLTAPPAGTSIVWYTSPIGGAPVSPTLNAVGTRIYYAEANNGTCPSLTRSPGVSLTILGAPAAPTSGGNITQCVDNIAGNKYTATATSPAGTSVTWWNQSSGGNTVVPTLASNIAGTVTYYAESKDDMTHCTSLTRTAVTITIVDYPTAPTTTGDQVGCQRATVLTLTASATAAAGSTLRWFATAAGGTPITGAPTLNAVGTITYYAESYIAASGCASFTRTPVKLTINPAPAVPTSSIGNITQCATIPTQTLTAQATPPAGSTLAWYTTATGGSPVAPATWDQVGATSYYAESIDNVGCVSTTRTRVILTINNTPDAPIPGTPSSDGTYGEVIQCEQTPIQTLTATATIPTTAPVGTTIRWYTTATGGTPLAANAQIRRTVGTSTYYAESYIAAGTCPSLTRTKVVLTINPAPAAPVSLGNITKCAESPIIAIDANTQINQISGFTYEWFNSLTGGDFVEKPVLSEVNSVPYYVESININSMCRSLRRTAVTLTIRDSPAPLDSLKDIKDCATTPIQTLTAPTPVTTDGSLIRWFSKTGAAVSRPTLSAVGTVTYYAEAYKGTCSLPVSARMPIVLTISALPAAPVSLGNVTVCSTDTILDANKRIAPTPLTPKVGVEWFTLASGGTAVSPRWNTVGSMIYYAEALDSLTGCRSSRRTAVTLTINAAPLPLDKINPIIECAATPLQTLSVPTITPSDGALIRWYSTATGGAAITRPTLNAVRSTTFYAEAYKGTCVSPTRIPVTLTINALPAAPVSKGNPLPVCAVDTVLDASTRITSPSPRSLEWFTTATGGTPVSPRWNTVGAMTYYAEALDTITGCRSSKRTAVTLTINAAPLPLDKIPDQIACATSPIQTLNVPTITPTDGSLIRWYSTANGGIALTRPTLNTVGSITYYAEAYKGTCTSPRMPVILKINPSPAIPVSLGNLTVCANDTLIQTLDANTRIAPVIPANPNLALEWFTSATGGTPVSPTLNIIGTATFYAEAKYLDTECRSTRRTAVTLTLNETPAPPVGSPITECVGKTVQTLTAKVTVPANVTVTWWDAATGGKTVTFPTLNVIGTKTYYAEARLGNCTNSRRTKITLTINPLPANPTYFGTTTGIIAPVCEPDSVDASKWAKPGAPTSKLFWYDALTLGNAASPIQKAPATRNVYAESVDSITGCAASKRIPITMTVNTQPPPTLVAKYANGVIKECALPKVQTLNARNALNITAGLTLKWYDKPTGGVIVANPTWSTVNDSITYYAAYQKPGGCESATRTAVKLMITSPLVSTSSNSPLTIGQDLKLFGGAEVFGYTYVWTDPRKFTYTGMDQLIPNVTSAMSGMYKLTVTDPSGCSSSDSTKVTISSAKASYQQTCLGGTLYLSGLPDNMVYSWKGPNNFSSTEQSPAINNVTAAMAGKYKLQVIDPAGTTSIDSITVAFKTLPIPLISVATICPAGTLQLSGNPSGMVSYTWTGPGGALVSTLRNPPVMAYPVPSDSIRFTLTVRDQNGCEAATSVIPIAFSPKATYNAPLCSGDTLKLRGEPSGMASYSWRDPAGAVISTLQSPIIKNVTNAGIYTLTVKDKSGCTFSSTVDVSFSTPVVKPIITITPNPACEGNDLTLRASPSGMNTYEWAGPNGFTSTDQNPVLINLKPVNAGTYSLKVTNGCASYANPVTLSVNSVNFVGTYGPYCISDSKVTLIATPSGVIFNGPGITGNVFDPASAGAGVHSIQYTYNGVGCTISSFFQIEVYVKPTLVVNPAALVLKTCTGTTSDLTLPAVTAGSSTGLTLSYWKDSKASISLTTPKAVTAGTYYIKGISKSGKCFDIQAAFVSQPDSLRATMNPLAELSCAGDTTGSMTVNVTLGNAPFNYLWSTKPVQNTATAKNLKAGIYTVVVTDAKKCVASFTGEIKEPAPIRLGFRTKAVQCMSDANGSASVDTINGSTDIALLNSYKYKWLTNPVQTTREALRLTPLWHRISVTDPNNCVKKDSVFISVTDTMRPLITCPKDINLTVEYLKTADLSPNKYIVDLGKPLIWDNCSVIDTMVFNDAPLKFRTGETQVKWTVTDQVGLINACIQKVYIKEIPLIPQMISPNGDGLNDKFIIDGLTAKEYRDSQLLIFTRSGQLVFQSNNYEDPANAWDGKYTESTFSKNQLVAPGVYYYILKLGGTSSQTLRGYVYVYY